MLMSDLIGSHVVDADGKRLGRVTDVRLVQDGPYIEGFGNALRVDGLVIGRAGIANRIGYARGGVRGPWLLRRLASALEGKAWIVPWTDVTASEAGFAVGRARHALPRVRDVYLVR
jgi:sporulation protein YlmC with PRC-barrel domain